MRRQTVALVALLVAIGAPAGAQTFTWSSTHANWNWDTASLDWTTGSGNVAWVNSTTASQALFTTTGSTVTVSSGIQANAITFNAGATGYYLTGGGITLGSGGVTAHETATIKTPITLFGGTQSWTVDSGKNLTVGALGDAGNAYGLVKTGPGTLTLTASSSYGGGTTVQGGKLSFSAGAVPGPPSSPILLSGGTLSMGLQNAGIPGPTSIGSGLVVQVYNDASRTTDQVPNFASYAALTNWWPNNPAASVGPLAYATSALTAANANQALNFAGPANNQYGSQIPMFNVIGLGNLGAQADNQYFDAVLSGAIALGQTGTYTFSTTSDDGSVLFINGEMVVNNNAYQPATTRTGTFTVTTPGLFPIQIGYYQGSIYDGLDVRFQPPGSSSMVDLPNAVLGTPVGLAVTYNNPVTMSTSSTIDVQAGSVNVGLATFGALTFSNTGTTLTSTGSGGVSFSNSVLGGGPGTYSFTVNGPELVPGPISASGAATIAVGGSGVLTLTASGGSQLAGSTFRVGSGATLLAVGQNSFQGAAVTLQGGATLILAATAATAAYDVMLPTSANPITFPAGGAATILAGDVSPTGGALAGPLQAGAVYAATVNLASSGTLAVASGQTLNLGTLGSYTLAQGPSLVLAASGTVAVTSGGGVVLLGPNLLLAPAAQLTVANGATATINGTFTGMAANLAPAVGGTLVLNSANSLSGTLAVNGGAFIAGNSASFGNAALQLSGGTLGANVPLTGANAIANPLSWGGIHAIAIGGSAAIEFKQPLSLATAGSLYTISDPAGYSTFSGAISGSGGLSITGSPTFSTSNTYSGGTTLNGNANVTITNNHGLGSGPLFFNNGGFQAAQPLTGALAVTNAWSVAAGQEAFFYGANTIEMTRGIGATGFWIDIPSVGGHVIIDGPITGTGWLANYDAGMLTLNNPGSTFSGSMEIVQEGTVDVPVSSVGPAGTPTSGPLGTGLIYMNSANWNRLGNCTGAAPVILGNALQIHSEAMYDGGAHGITFAGPISLDAYWGGNLGFPHNPAMIFTHGSVTFSGNVGDGGSGYMLYLGSGNNWNTGGALTLSGSNTFTGGVLISQGTLLVASSAALGPPSNAVTLNDPPNTAIGTSQDPTNALGTTQDPWGYKSGAGETDQISALLIGGPYTVPNPIHVQAYGNGSYLGGNTASSATFSGPITLDQTTTLVAAPGGTIAFSNTISGAGGVVVGASGYTGTVILSGPNAYTGGTTLVSGGTLALGNSGALQQSTLDTSGNGVLSFGSLRSAMLGGLTGPGTLTLINTASAAVALSVGNNNNSTTFSGILQGAGSLTKIGSGTLTVTGNNAYSGGTSINAGSLIVAGSLAKTAVAVEGGASLGGTGTIGGSVTVAGGSGPSTWGTISLVDGAAGTLTLSDAISTDTVLTLGGGGGGSPSALDFEVGATADRILIAAGKLLVNSGGGVINVTPLAGFGPGTYDLMDFLSGQASGLGNLTLGTPTLPGYTLSLRSTPTAEQLVVQSVPEPSTLALLGAGAISLVAFAWRRRRQAS